MESSSHIKPIPDVEQGETVLQQKDQNILEATKLACVLVDLQEFVRMIQDANSIYDSYPPYIKKKINEVKNPPALLLANTSDEDRQNWTRYHKDLFDIIESISGVQRPWLPNGDEQIIVLLVKLLPKLQVRSKMQLRQFIEAALVGDTGFLFAANKGNKAEVRHRHKVPKEVLDEFDVG